MNCYFRSRDLYKAWFMNVYALTGLQAKFADMLSERLQQKVSVGEYTDTSDSLHIYGAYFSEFQEHLKPMRSPERFERRVLGPGLPFYEGFVESIAETQAKLKEDPDFMKCK